MKDDLKMYILNYATLFGAYLAMVGLWFFAPIVVAMLGGLLVIMIGATLSTRLYRKRSAQKNIFDVAKQYGKKLVFALLPGNRISLFLADWNVGNNKIKMKVYDGRRWKMVERTLVPEQEFDLGVSEVKIEKGMSIYDVVANPKILWKLEEPRKQVWNIDGYNVPAVLMVFPDKVISETQLKVWNTAYQGAKKIKISEGGVTSRDVEIPVFSPLSYAVSSTEVQTLSATHRFSELSTLMDTTRDLLENAERIVAGSIPKKATSMWAKVSDFLRQAPQVVVVICVMLALLGGFLILSKGLGGAFSQGIMQGATKVAGAKANWP